MRHSSVGSKRGAVRWLPCLFSLGLGLSPAFAAPKRSAADEPSRKADAKTAAKAAPASEAAVATAPPAEESGEAPTGTVPAAERVDAAAPGEALTRLASTVTADDAAALTRFRTALDKERSLDVLAAVSEEGLDPAAVAWLRARRATLLKAGGKSEAAQELTDLLLSEATADQREPLRKALGARPPVADASVRGRLGVALPLTGKYKKWGEFALDGIKLRLGDQAGVELVIEDTKGEADVAAAAMDRLAAKGVMAVIGAMGRKEAPKAARRAQALGVPLISLSKLEGLTTLGDMVFRFFLTNPQQGRALAHYAADVLGARSSVVVAPESPAAREVEKGFGAELSSVGGKVVGSVHYAPKTKSFDDVAKKVTGSGKYGSVLIADRASEVGLIAPALDAGGVSVGCDKGDITLLGIQSWDSKDLVSRAGKSVHCAVYVTGLHTGSKRSQTRAFVKAHADAYVKKNSKRKATFLEAYAYDAAGLVAQLMADPSVDSRAALRERLASLKGYEGATGAVSFNADREGERPLFFLRVSSKGGLEELSEVKISGTAAPGTLSANLNEAAGDDDAE